MIGLARETGWSEHYLLHEIPYARLLLYQHAHLRGHRAWTVPVGSILSLEEQAEKLGL